MAHTSDETTTSASRYAPLDGLRAMAILLVVFYHMHHELHDSTRPLRDFFATGWNGVYLFFVLSGFLIGTLLISELRRHASVSITRFWIRRFLRTWPLYFVLLGVFAWRAPRIDPPFWNYLVFTQNFYPNVGFFTQTWSLAVEEQFYFVLPVIATFLIIPSRVIGAQLRVPLAFTVGLFFPFFYRLILGGSTNIVAVMDALVIGLLIAALKQYRPRLLEPVKASPNFVFLIGLLIIYVPITFDTRTNLSQAVLFAAQGIGFGLILIASFGERLWIAPVLRSKVAYYIALVSYSVYLTHDRPLYKLARLAEGLGLTGWQQAGFMLAFGVPLTIAVGALCYLLIEKPGMVLRDRYFPRR